MLGVHHLTVRFGSATALDAIDLTTEPAEVVALVGPSGSGKTTLLRVIAGLQAPDSGSVTWDGSDLSGVSPDRRRFGLMFQDLALFPHKDVGGNVSFGLRGEPGAAERTRRVLALVGLAGAERRRVSELSGGEQQRVALARALAPSPRLLMLDEPLGSLDRVLRERLVEELRSIFVNLAIPVLYVSHDQDEAFAVADRVAVMQAGRVVQTGAPEEVWRRPATEFVARFLGFGNIGDAVIDHGSAATPWGPVPVGSGARNGAARVVVRPDAVRLDPAGEVEAIVEECAFRGDRYVVRLTPEHGPEIEAWLGHRAEPGTTVCLTLTEAVVIG